MKTELWKKPKGVTIITGFPGMGLVGTITTEFLIEHLSAELIGKIRVEEVPPVIAIHQGKVVEPLGIFYNKKYNLIILHALTSVAGIEWKLGDEICKIINDLNAKEIISLEGIGSSSLESPKVYYYSNKKDGLKKLGVLNLNEGIIIGVTGSLLLKGCTNHICFFAETHSTMPDSKAAAKIIEVLDRHLGLKVDYKPLMEKAVKFEGKIKELLEKREKASKFKERKELTYLG